MRFVRIVPPLVLAACLAVPLAALAAEDAAPNPRAIYAPLTLPQAPNAYRSGSGRPGPAYWQNRADYRIDVAIDPDKQQLHGTETITYTNNSPDSLDALWLHLDQNIYRPDARAAIGSAYFGKHFTEGDQLDSVTVIDGARHYVPRTLVSDTRLNIRLDTPLHARGGALKLRIAWHYTVPGPWGGRTAVSSNPNGDIYEIAQFYPRMAVYDDLRGWDTLPYLGAEFYLEYGKFDYSVTLPSNMIVAGSGALTNPNDVLSTAQRARLDQARQSDATVTIRSAQDVQATPRDAAGTKTWRFHMDHTRDVAFAASRAFVWDAARIDLPDRKTALAMSVYPQEVGGAADWARSTQYVKGALEHFSAKWLPYPWPVAINVAGHGANMEYPGIVFDGVKDLGKDLFWITAHEIGHSYFPMIVGSNERRWAFMDEGFNTFIDVYASDAFNHGEFAPKRDSEYSPGGGHPADEIVPLLKDPQAPIILTPADDVGEKYRHPVEYFKPALGMVLLREQILGPVRFDAAFRRYIRAWAYKHPDPSDFFRMMESEGGEDLSWWWRGWYMHNWALDYAIDSVAPVDGDPARGTAITLVNKGALVMPATLAVTFADGHTRMLHLPVEMWRGGDRQVLTLHDGERVIHAAIDPGHAIPDADRGNGVYDAGAAPKP